MLRILTLVFLGLSLFFWLATNYTANLCVESISELYASSQGTAHKHPETREEGGKFADPPTKNLNGDEAQDDVVNWLKDHIPSDVKWNQSLCPAVSEVLSKSNNPLSHPPTFTVLGAINSSFRTIDNEHIQLAKLGNTGTLLTSIATSSTRNDEPMDVSTLEPLVPVIASLANYNIVKAGNTVMTKLIHALDSLNIEWLGLSAKKYRILKVRDTKVGFLAFCCVSSKCTDSGFMPFAPVRYAPKTARESIEDLRKFGVETIIVMVYWGIKHSFFPDETALYVARHLAEFPEVSVIIGHHPQHVQGHAYFGKTLVLFSPGNFLIQDNSSSLCWNRMLKNQWTYSDSIGCRNVHPAIRHGLLERESETRVYKLYLNKRMPTVSQYATLPLDFSRKTGLRLPIITSPEWITVCGKFDSQCLSCNPY